MITLVDQLADRIRRDIVMGQYRPGDVLPSLNALAKMSGTSLRVPRMAIDKLHRAGLVACHRGKPAEVCGSIRGVWRGHIVHLCSEGEVASGYSNVFDASLRRTVVNAGFLYSRIVIPFRKNGHRIYSEVLRDFRQKIDLVITSDGSDEMARFLSSRGVSYVVTHPWCVKSPNLVAYCDSKIEIEPFRRLCRQNRIRTMLLVCVDHRNELVRQAAASGLETELVEISPTNSRNLPAQVELQSYRYFRKRVGKGRALPDLVFLADDYVARGALFAFAERGVCVPRDIRAVMFMNRDFEYPTPCRPTCFMDDFAGFGERLGDWTVSYLTTSRRERCVPCLTRYVPGESF